MDRAAKIGCRVVESSGHRHFYVADETAHTPNEQLLLIVGISAEDNESADARCVAADLWGFH
ncbi:hypothetical protein AQJ54_39720 [Streptomyces griseorubiginosus]|uniref:Uncharacterized protein n=1 Tax=Streptomyces griseorubiginosus TaxID=67304 RepID=A0A101RPQ2_9ACTN|nr:hypothetical protein AQJ54_39720 [Streptomyces griseorubiginosus]